MYFVGTGIEGRFLRKSPITYNQGCTISKELQCFGYFEVSVDEGVGLLDLFSKTLEVTSSFYEVKKNFLFPKKKEHQKVAQMIFGEDYYSENKITLYQIEKLTKEIENEKKEREKLQKTVLDLQDILKQQQNQLDLQQKLIDRLFKNDKKIEEDFGLTPRRNITHLDLEGLKKNQITEIKLYPSNKSPHTLVSPRKETVKRDSAELQKIKLPRSPTKEKDEKDEESNLTKALQTDKKKCSKTIEEDIKEIKIESKESQKNDPKIEIKVESKDQDLKEEIERRKSEPITYNKFALNAERIRERRKSEGETPKKRTFVLGQAPVQVGKGAFSLTSIKNRALSEPSLGVSENGLSNLSTSRTKSELVLSSAQTLILNLNQNENKSQDSTTSSTPLSGSPDINGLSNDELSISFSPEDKSLNQLIKKHSH